METTSVQNKTRNVFYHNSVLENKDYRVSSLDSYGKYYSNNQNLW